jgi:hypothetical protein
MTAVNAARRLSDTDGRMKRESLPILLVVGGAAAGVVLMIIVLLSGADQAHAPRIPPSSAAQSEPAQR